MTLTPTGARRTISSATLPSRTRETPSRPWVPTTTWSMSLSLQYWTMVWAGGPLGSLRSGRRDVKHEGGRAAFRGDSDARDAERPDAESEDGVDDEEHEERGDPRAAADHRCLHPAAGVPPVDDADPHH